MHLLFSKTHFYQFSFGPIRRDELHQNSKTFVRHSLLVRVAQVVASMRVYRESLMWNNAYCGSIILTRMFSFGQSFVFLFCSLDGQTIAASFHNLFNDLERIGKFIGNMFLHVNQGNLLMICKTTWKIKYPSKIVLISRITIFSSTERHWESYHQEKKHSERWLYILFFFIFSYRIFARRI